MTDPTTPLFALDHVQLAMPEGDEALHQARRFYGDVLGLLEQPKPKPLAARGGCWFVADALHVHLGVMPDFIAAQKAHPAFLVHDLEALRARLDQAGISYREDDALPERARLYVFDPFGNRLEMIQDGDGFSQR